MPIDVLAGSGDSGSESDSDLGKIEIDKDFARRLEHNKKREALQRYEELKKQGRIPDSESVSDSDSDSDSDFFSDPDEVKRTDLAFFKTLKRVRNNDPEILKKETKIYHSNEEKQEEEKEGKQKRVKKNQQNYLKDVNARNLLEGGPEFETKEESSKYNRNLYDSEQKAAREAFFKAQEEALGSDNGETDDFFKEREKKEVDSEKDEDEQEVDQQLDEYFGKDDNLDENERFLKEYLKKKLWIDKDKGKNNFNLEFDAVSEEEDELDKQDKYEAEYNFRHEELGMTDRVLGHSRIVEGSVRKKESTRKKQRKSKEERMAREEQERKEELKHLKNLKKREIQEKLEKIRNVAGIGDEGLCKLGEEDLEEEFDPNEYDKKMKEVFDTGYYESQDADLGFRSGNESENDLEKPDFSKEDELLGLEEGWDIVDGSNNNEGFAKARERTLQKKEGREGKLKLSLKEKVELDKELEEYYKLDYEDTIGDLKTRFKYRSVPANRYGLKPWEILNSNDMDLNQYVSLKKIVPYRESEWKVHHHQKKNKDLILGGDKIDSKKEGKKNKKNGTEGGESSRKLEREMEGTELEEAAKGEEKLSKSSKRRKRKAELKMSQSRLEAYGKIPAKKHKKK